MVWHILGTRNPELPHVLVFQSMLNIKRMHVLQETIQLPFHYIGMVQLFQRFKEMV